MRRLLRILIGLLLFFILLLSISFSLLNRVPVALEFGLLTLSPQPLSVWIIGAFCLGGVLGVLLGAGFLRSLRNRGTIKGLQKELAARNQEIDSLKMTIRRNSPLDNNQNKPGKP